MTFRDDEPVLLDCSCIAGPGDDYYEVLIPEEDIHTHKIKYHHVTYCGDENYCFYEAIRDYLDVEKKHVDTSEDKAYEYGDILYDMQKDDGY